MKSFCVYEMEYTGKAPASADISPIPFDDRYYPQYERIYNECFFDMRRALDIEPFNVYSDISQLGERKKDLFLLMGGDDIIGSVSCCGNQIDDLIVSRQFQGRGYGRALLRWAISHIREYSDEPVTLHAAEWNAKAVRLYLSSGFVIKKRERIG